MDETEAAVRLSGIFHGSSDRLDQRRHPHTRNQWHNLKYYTWVEQQGKTVEELDAQRDPAFWLAEQAKVQDVDRQILAYRHGR